MTICVIISLNSMLFTKVSVYRKRDNVLLFTLVCRDSDLPETLKFINSHNYVLYEKTSSPPYNRSDCLPF